MFMFLLFLIYFPTLLFGFLFFRNYRKEPRQFRNALYLLLLCLFLFCGLSIQFQLPWLVIIGLAVIPLGTAALVVFLVANTFVVVKREGFTLSHILPALFALLIVLVCIAFPLFAMMEVPSFVLALSGLITLEGSYFAFTFLALLLYSGLYRHLPKRSDYNYVVVHGAGLSGAQPTPLLAGRLDKAVELWKAIGCKADIIVSGGQGDDEQVSEAAAMKTYLVDKHGVPDKVIIKEEKSTTTWENLVNSKAIMDARSGVDAYRAAVVTSDYHVFRTAEYAHKIGLAADGVGSKTARYFWPTAFIREYVAVNSEHRWPFVMLFIVWLVPAALIFSAR